MWSTVKKSYHPDPGGGRGGATVLYFYHSKPTLIMPLLCLVAQLHLQWNPSHLSEGKEFPLPLEEVSLHLPDLTNFNCDAGFQLLLLLKGHLSFTCGSFPSCFPFSPFQINAS